MAVGASFDQPRQPTDDQPSVLDLGVCETGLVKLIAESVHSQPFRHVLRTIKGRADVLSQEINLDLIEIIDQESKQPITAVF